MSRSARRPDEAPPPDERLEAAEEVIGYRFADRALLEQALTHRSWVNEARDPAVEHNERLEFLGDAVLGFLAADRLYREAPDAREGPLTRRRAAYVSEVGIAGRPGPAALGPLLRLGKGQASAAGHELPSIVSDATEAVIAAVYLDGGLKAAGAVVERLLGSPPEDVEPTASPKTVLQERVQRLLGRPPTYGCERVAGPDHAPRFEASVRVGGHLLGRAEGASKRDATLAAARAALDVITPLSDQELLRQLGSGPDASAEGCEPDPGSA